MKFEVYCAECQEDGPTFKTTPLGPAFGSQENQIAWTDFLQKHVECGDAQFGLRTAA